MRQHHAAEFGEMRVRPFAPEELSSELVLELLDGSRQGRLRNVQPLGRSREIQVLGDR